MASIKMKLRQMVRWIKKLFYLNAQIDSINEQLQYMDERIEKISEAIEIFEQKTNRELINNNNVIQKTLRTEMDISRQQLEGQINCMFDVGFGELLKNEEKLSELNRSLSTHMTIWGDENKVHISPLASVDSCLINVNSGEVEIGDYTFAGSNVSILAGSHDVHLKGFIRRDIEYTEGYDIKIGRGVWLASNSVVIGPCDIGDNAVVAAGAVVTPGTVIPENTIYAGIPARKISSLSFIEGDKEYSEYNEAFMAALTRNKGIVFLKGISEKKTIVYNNRIYYGGWKNKNEIEAYTKNKEDVLLFYSENNMEYTLYMETDDVKEEMEVKEQFRMVKIKNGSRGEIKKIRFTINNNVVRLFIGYRSEPLKE